MIVYGRKRVERREDLQRGSNWIRHCCTSGKKNGLVSAHSLGVHLNSSRGY